MKKKNKIILLVSILAIIILGVIGVAYAYSSLFTGNNQQLVLGDIYMNYNETNQLVLEGVMPSESYDTSNYFEFTINGKNTYQDKDIYYEIVLNHGDDHTTRTERIKDNLLKFTLVEIKDSTETIVVNGATYDEINATRIWVNTIGKNTNSDVNITYRLYMWISDETTICGGTMTGCDYDMDTWNDEVYASIKVNVLGDFESKSVGTSTAAEEIIAKVGTDGLVAINTDGGLYSGTGTIREYRYSGTDVNNYVYFNCKDSDGTYNYGDENYNYASNCETWRIIGVFEEDSEQVVKIVRNTTLTDSEIPATYRYNGINFTLDEDEYGTSHWNSEYTSDWTTAGLQYFLNTESDSSEIIGYLGMLTTNTKNLIRTTTYNLGNVSDGNDGATAITAYEQERGTTECASSVTSNSHNSSCNIWYGNQPSWNGKVALLYPSDYGYASTSSYWSKTLYSVRTTNWLQTTANNKNLEWFLSPSSKSTYIVMSWYSDGYVSTNGISDYYIDENPHVRPCLYLVSSAKILKGTGESSSPYIFIA